MKQRDVCRSLGWGSWGKQRCHPLTAGILVLVLIAQSGCASSGTDKRSAATLLFPLPREAFQRLGTVAVTSGRFAPTFDIVNGPMKGAVWGASKGALEGFFAPLQIPAPPPLTIIPILLMPVGLVAGAIEGAKAEPAVKVEEREATIREIVTGERIQNDLRDRVVAIGRAKTPHTLTVLADRGPSAAGEQPDYSPLSQDSIQTVLEIVVESVILQGRFDLFPDTNPKLRLVVTVNRRLVRTVDNLEIDAKRSTCYGKRGQTLEEWVGDPEGFRNELNQAYADVAEMTVRELLLRGLD